MNPVASATLFKKLTQAILEQLLRCVPETARKTIPLSARHKGIFGRVLAYCYVIETQGRLALHKHLAAFTTCSPSLLQATAVYPHLRSQIATIIDKLFQAYMPPRAHIDGLIHRLKKQPLIRAAYLPHLQQEDDITTIAFKNRLHQIIESYQIHSHRATCHKNNSISCRMAKPSGLVPETGAVELDVTTDEDDQVQYTIKPTISPLEHQFGRNRNRLLHPLPKEDPRAIVWELSELKRPMIDVRKLLEYQELSEELIKELNIPEDEESYFSEAQQIDLLDLVDLPEDMTVQEWEKVAKALLKRNGSVVDVSPTASTVLNCNTAAYHLGSLQQGRATMFYLVKYMTKDSVALSTSLSILHSAMQHVKKYPSIAEDTGTAKRTAQHFLLRAINLLSGQSEVSATQAAASLLGMTSQSFSCKFAYLYIRPAINYIFLQQGDTEGIKKI